MYRKKILKYSIWGQWQQQRNAIFLELYFFPNLRSMWHTGIIYISSAHCTAVYNTLFLLLLSHRSFSSIFLAFAMFVHYSSSSRHNFVIMSWRDGETNDDGLDHISGCHIVKSVDDHFHVKYEKKSW